MKVLRRVVVFDAADVEAAGLLATGLGVRQLQEPRRPADNPDGTERFAVYAGPAGHPVCFGVH